MCGKLSSPSLQQEAVSLYRPPAILWVECVYIQIKQYITSFFLFLPSISPILFLAYSIAFHFLGMCTFSADLYSLFDINVYLVRGRETSPWLALKGVPLWGQGSVERFRSMLLYVIIILIFFSCIWIDSNLFIFNQPCSQKEVHRCCQEDAMRQPQVYLFYYL